MTNHPHRRRVHLYGETMTACGKIIGGSMRGHKLERWLNTLPSWRCKACVKAVEARAEAVKAVRVEIPDDTQGHLEGIK